MIDPKTPRDFENVKENTSESLMPSMLMMSAYNDHIRQLALAKSPYEGIPSKPVPERTKEQKMQDEIDTLKKRLELARQVLAGDLDGYDPDWD